MSVDSDRRSSPRLSARIAVLVEGRDSSGQGIREETYTLLVNHSGALLALSARFEWHDPCTVTNQSSGVKAPCRIVWRSSVPIAGRWSYGITFVDPLENFWGLKE